MRTPPTPSGPSSARLRLLALLLPAQLRVEALLRDGDGDAPFELELVACLKRGLAARPMVRFPGGAGGRVLQPASTAISETAARTSGAATATHPTGALDTRPITPSLVRGESRDRLLQRIGVGMPRERSREHRTRLFPSRHSSTAPRPNGRQSLDRAPADTSASDTRSPLSHPRA